MNKDLNKEKIVITAGATREELYPVSFISNYSPGKMGFALAEAASLRGATVTVIAAATTASLPDGVRIEQAFSAATMLHAALEEVTAATVFIAAAAVADFRPIQRAGQN